MLQNILISYLEFLFPNLAYFGLFCHLKKKEQIGQEFVIHCLISSGGGGDVSPLADQIKDMFFMTPLDTWKYLCLRTGKI